MKPVFRKILRATVGAPTPWLGIGVAALCASLALSYLRSQVEADYALAMRVGAPQPVAITEGPLPAGSEGHVIARFHPERAAVIRLGVEDAGSAWLAVPLEAVSNAETQADDPVRPLSRPESRVSTPVPAFGVALFPVHENAPEALLSETGRLYEGPLNGPLLSSTEIGTAARTALVATGVSLPENFTVIQPWIGGRAAALAPAAPSQLPQYLFWVGVAAVLGAIGLSIWPDEQDRYLDMGPSESERRVITRSRVKSDAHRFNPLIGQDDIRRGAMERLAASERAKGRTPSQFHTTGPAAKVGGGWVKSRR